jgi:hypothetical protein
MTKKLQKIMKKYFFVAFSCEQGYKNGKIDTM